MNSAAHRIKHVQLSTLDAGQLTEEINTGLQVSGVGALWYEAR